MGNDAPNSDMKSLKTIQFGKDAINVDHSPMSKDDVVKIVAKEVREGAACGKISNDTVISNLGILKLMHIVDSFITQSACKDAEVTIPAPDKESFESCSKVDGIFGNLPTVSKNALEKVLKGGMDGTEESLQDIVKDSKELQRFINPQTNYDKSLVLISKAMAKKPLETYKTKDEAEAARQDGQSIIEAKGGKDYIVVSTKSKELMDKLEKMPAEIKKITGRYQTIGSLLFDLFEDQSRVDELYDYLDNGDNNYSRADFINDVGAAIKAETGYKSKEEGKKHTGIKALIINLFSKNNEKISINIPDLITASIKEKKQELNIDVKSREAETSAQTVPLVTIEPPAQTEPPVQTEPLVKIEEPLAQTEPPVQTKPPVQTEPPNKVVSAEKLAPSTEEALSRPRSSGTIASGTQRPVRKFSGLSKIAQSAQSSPVKRTSSLSDLAAEGGEAKLNLAAERPRPKSADFKRSTSLPNDSLSEFRSRSTAYHNIPQSKPLKSPIDKEHRELSMDARQAMDNASLYDANINDLLKGMSADQLAKYTITVAGTEEDVRVNNLGGGVGKDAEEAKEIGQALADQHFTHEEGGGIESREGVKAPTTTPDVSLDQQQEGGRGQ